MNIHQQRLQELLETQPSPLRPRATFSLPLETSDAWLKANESLYTADQLRDLIKRQRAAGLRTE
jgi:hypothetical protein